ncbi:uncharacterized protein LOC128965494 [Oppia nitens]|uniref:uncharacterized protein LOC128965494 n=1 Tax=Oppia nitens TaxID=1686743 RepID=UPI0023DC1E5E|nr:uncharacterized protein LOC128965494 [Oppia nitens]
MYFMETFIALLSISFVLGNSQSIDANKDIVEVIKKVDEIAKVENINIGKVEDIGNVENVGNVDNVKDGIGSEESTDPTIVFSETINSATKLLYDLDAHVQQLVPNNADEISTTLGTTESVTSEPHIYSAISSEFELALSKQGESVGALVTQLDTLQQRIQDTVTELTNRRRYILSAMLRPMLNSVRRIRSNVVRIQTQLTSIQSAAAQVGTRPGGAQTLGAADQTAIDSIRKRVDDIQKRISDIIGRISSSLNIPGASPAAVSQNNQNNPPAGR